MNPVPRPRITLVTSNGWGLGHLSRQIAIGLALDGRADLTMFSFSRGLPLAEEFGIRGEFCPGHDSAWIPRERWNAYVEMRFRTFVAEVDPGVVLFDGVAPYLGVLNALLDFPSISAGWLRRGMWLKGRSDVQLSKAAAFDFVIEPGDIASAADRGPTSRLESIRVPPISLLEVVPLLDRAAAAAELGLDPLKPSLLFALGSGQPGDAVDARQVALEAALDHTDWQVGVVSSPLATDERRDVPGGIQLRGVYPLMRYLDAFDAAVSAAGYNSVHELVPARLPSLFVPKSASQTDDQVARASYLADNRLAFMADDHDLDAVREQTNRLLGEGGDHLRGRLAEVSTEKMSGGAGAVAELLIGSPPTGIRETGREEWRQPGVKGAIKRAIGPRGVAMVQRMLGRAPRTPPKNTVVLDGRHSYDLPRLRITDDLAVVGSSLSQPVEHLLPGASPDYRKARHELIDDFYDVIG